jgi:hypothetical protein
VVRAGGESRKSFHGYPDGFAQLIESPQSWHITPMQIDTRNRDCGVTPESVTNCTRYTPGVEPHQARYGRHWAGVDGMNPVGSSNYSGVLECPCTSNYGGDPAFYPNSKTKVIADKFTALPFGTCAKGHVITTADKCFTQVPLIGVFAKSFVNSTIADATSPSGCTVTTNADGTATATFNTAGTTTCPSSATKVGEVQIVGRIFAKVNLVESGSTKPIMTRSAKGEYCTSNHIDVLQKFVSKSVSVADEAIALADCEAFCMTSATCSACSVDHLQNQLNQWAAIPTCGAIAKWGGAIAGDISTKAVAHNGAATITLSGPATAWFGVGFNAQIMSEMPYTILVNDTAVWEQKLGTCGSEADHCPGTRLNNSLTVKSNSVVDGVRTVVVTRPFSGATKDHYTFSPSSVATIPVIGAFGKDQTFAYHVGHQSGLMTFTAPGVPTPICDDGGAGEICENGGTGCRTFTKNCVPAAAGGIGGDLKTQHNPTCTSAQYSGGLSCCHHMRIMLDQDQRQKHSLDRETLRYHMKFRFWFQEYVPSGSKITPQGTTKNTTASHYNLPRIYFQTEANAGEYDIPPAFATKENPKIPGYPDLKVGQLTPGTSCTGTCPDGDDCECVHTITYNHTVSNMRLIYAGGHCHAPSCLGIWLYRNDPGHEMELLCHQHPKYGTGHVIESEGGDKYDEAGYLSLPPCLWGDDKGLIPSILLPPNTELISIKKNKNTDTGHFGEMASWQMRGVNF